MVVESCESAENMCHSSREEACVDKFLEESCYEVVFGTETFLFWVL